MRRKIMSTKHLTYESLMELRDQMYRELKRHLPLEAKWEMLASKEGRFRLARFRGDDGRPFFAFKPGEDVPPRFMGMKVFDRPGLPDNIIILKPIDSEKIEDCIFYTLEGA